MACIHPALLFLLLFSVNSIASPTLHAPLHQEGTVSTEYPSTVWSNEAIFTLVGVCVAVVGVLIGLLSSPRLRQWLCKPFRCKRRIQAVFYRHLTSNFPQTSQRPDEWKDHYSVWMLDDCYRKNTTSTSGSMIFWSCGEGSRAPVSLGSIGSCIYPKVGASWSEELRFLSCLDTH